MASQLGRSLYIGLKADTKGFGHSLNRAEKNLERFKNGVKTLGTAVAAGFAAMGAIGIKFAFDAGKAASDFGETTSKVAVIFGKNAKDIQMFGEGAAKALGQSKQEALDAAANFAIFGKAAGKRGKDLVKFSTRLVTTAADMASFANTTPQEAIEALGSALRGEMEPIRKYGVLLDQETLKNRGRIMGFGNDIGNSLTGAQRIIFATSEIFDQLGKKGSNTLGDFARTSDSFANQQRIFRAGFENFRISLGEKLLPLMTRITRWGNEKFLPFLDDVRKGFSGEVNDKVTNKLKNLGGALGFGDGKSAGYTLGESLREAADGFGKLFKSLSGSEEGASTLTQLADALTKIANALTWISDKASGFKTFLDNTGDFARLLTMQVTPQQLKQERAAKGKATGGAVQRNTPYLVGENGPEMFIPSGSGAIRTNRQTMGGGTTIINLNGIVDADSARRSIEYVLQNSGKRIGGINLTGSAL